MWKLGNNIVSCESESYTNHTIYNVQIFAIVFVSVLVMVYIESGLRFGLCFCLCPVFFCSCMPHFWDPKLHFQDSMPHFWNLMPHFWDADATSLYFPGVNLKRFSFSMNLKPLKPFALFFLIYQIILLFHLFHLLLTYVVCLFSFSYFCLTQINLLALNPY